MWKAPILPERAAICQGGHPRFGHAFTPRRGAATLGPEFDWRHWMARHLGLARINCPSCRAEQLVPMNELVEGGEVQCPACSQQEAAQSVLGRYPELAELATLLRDLHAMRSGRIRRSASTRSGEASTRSGEASTRSEEASTRSEEEARGSRSRERV